MFLILSAAYLGQELESEFGKIPPSFLPLGNKRLFKYQVSLAPEGTQVYLSIPESFNPSEVDQLWFKQNNVQLILVPEALSLGASLVAAVNLSGHSLDTPLHILYGDTIFSHLPIGEDIASTSPIQDRNYNWAILTDDHTDWVQDNHDLLTDAPLRMIDGYFKFSQPRKLLQAITQSKWDFLQGLNRYQQSIGLTPITSEGWLDFGHVNTYYHSKAHFTTQRAFNELTINEQWIEKSSHQDKKIEAEANWFAHLPHMLRRHTPQFLGSGTSPNGQFFYRLEYLHHTALNELFVFAKLPSQTWEKILDQCLNFLSECTRFIAPNHVTDTNTLDKLFGEKTQQRLVQYCQNQHISLDTQWTFNNEPPVSLKQIFEQSNLHLPPHSEHLSILHGDFCFSNILYDFRAGKIKTIDPRGLTPSGTQTLYGDWQYDVAKLSHSILGLYDWIIAGYHHVLIEENTIQFSIAEEKLHRGVQQLFIDKVASRLGLNATQLYAMQIHLFLSMLPLHADDSARQQALFANAFRLYHILIRLQQ